MLSAEKYLKVDACKEQMANLWKVRVWFKFKVCALVVYYFLNDHAFV